MPAQLQAAERAQLERAQAAEHRQLVPVLSKLLLQMAQHHPDALTSGQPLLPRMRAMLEQQPQQELLQHGGDPRAPECQPGTRPGGALPQAGEDHFPGQPSSRHCLPRPTWRRQNPHTRIMASPHACYKRLCNNFLSLIIFIRSVPHEWGNCKPLPASGRSCWGNS